MNTHYSILKYLVKTTLFLLFSLNSNSQIATPVFNTDGGQYMSTLQVVISCETSGASIHYTTNGINPIENDPVIVSGTALNIPLGATMLKARAFSTGLLPSEIKSAIYMVGEKILCGYTHSFVIKSDSSLWIWGDNNKGQLGIGSTLKKFVPVKTPLSSLTGAAGGYEHTLALKTDGIVWSFGRNSEGQLGDSTIIYRINPVRINALSNIKNVAAGYYHSLAIKNDSTLWTWGKNTTGQLGLGDTLKHIAPVKVNSLTGVTAAAGGDGHSVALKTDGSVWTWGRNSEGQLGDGTKNRQTIPVQVSGFTAISISAGRFHTLALKPDGTVWAFGYNLYGQLGNGDKINHSTPVQVYGLTNIIAISAGEYHSLALKDDGTVWAWGNNALGQLGDQTFTNRVVPTQIPGLIFNTFINASSQSLFLTSFAGKNLFWGCGNNSNGQIGDSSIVNKNSLVLVHFPFDENNNGISDWKDFGETILSDGDKDGLPTWTELFVYGTSPANFDVNSDGLADGVNVFISLHPTLTDTDGDGISNIQEILNGISPTLADTDGDGVPDNLDAFPLDRFKSQLPPADLSDHTKPVITLF